MAAPSRAETHRVFAKTPLVSAVDAIPSVPSDFGFVDLTRFAFAPHELAAPAFANPLNAADFVLGSSLWANAEAGSVTNAIGRHTDGNSDLAVRGDLARSEYGVDGSGITIGILSDSFDVGGGMAADIANRDLPAGISILKEGAAGSHDEGRAMAELIHRIAPGAHILFYTATDGEADFAHGIGALQAAGANIIVDDVAYLHEPFFQSGSAVQTAVAAAVAGGVSYFTAASNAGQNYVEEATAPMQLAARGLSPGVTVQNFGTAASGQPWANVTVPTGGVLRLDLQWDQPFASIGRGPGSADSLGMALYDMSGHIMASAGANVVGGDPTQVLSFANSTAGTAFKLVVYLNGGAALPGMFKIINYGNGQIQDPTPGGSGTVIGHEMVAGANTVGAVAWSSSSRFGGSNAAESYSAVGTGTFLYDARGQRLATPVSAEKVNFSAPDGSATSVFAPFYGTSAAAPSAAAVAALMLQADRSLLPAQVSQLLAESAAPSSSGPLAAGAGLIQADSAVRLALDLVRHV